MIPPVYEDLNSLTEAFALDTADLLDVVAEGKNIDHAPTWQTYLDKMDKRRKEYKDIRRHVVGGITTTAEQGKSDKSNLQNQFEAQLQSTMAECFGDELDEIRKDGAFLDRPKDIECLIDALRAGGVAYSEEEKQQFITQAKKVKSSERDQSPLHASYQRKS